MSKKGGYIIIDLKDTPLTAGIPVTKGGIYEKLERAPKKTVLLSGLTIGDEEKRDVFVEMQKNEDTYTAIFGDKQLFIDSENELEIDEYTSCKIIKTTIASVNKSLSSVVVPSKSILELSETVDITGDIDPNKYQVTCVPRDIGSAGPSLPSGIIFWIGPMMSPNMNRLTATFYLYNNTDTNITFPENRGVYANCTIIVMKR